MGVECAAWGLFGGFSIEALALIADAKQLGDWPWRATGHIPGPVLALAVALRLGIGAGLAAAAGSSGQIGTAFGAVAVGVAANKIIEGMSAQISLTPSNSQSEAGSAGSPADEPRPSSLAAGEHDAR